MRMFRRIATLAIVASTLSCQPDEPFQPRNPAMAETSVVDEMYHLVGQGNYVDLGSQPDLVVNAVRTFAGTVSGQVVIPEVAYTHEITVKAGIVTGIVPPSASYNYWCVAAALVDQPGVTFLVYIKDLAGGTDEVTFGGYPGATCEASPAPFGEWNPLLTGDFTGTVKTK